MNRIETYENGLKTVGDLKRNLMELVDYEGDDPSSFTIDSGNARIEFSAFGF